MFIKGNTLTSKLLTLAVVEVLITVKIACATEKACAQLWQGTLRQFLRTVNTKRQHVDISILKQQDTVTGYRTSDVCNIETFKKQVNFLTITKLLLRKNLNKTVLYKIELSIAISELQMETGSKINIHVPLGIFWLQVYYTVQKRELTFCLQIVASSCK